MTAKVIPMADPSPADLLSFRNALRACTDCSLRSSATSPVPWHGDTHPDIAIIGEAPGRTEDVVGKPFQGSAGNRLNWLLKQASVLPHYSITYLNACQCFPGRGLDAVGDYEYIRACQKWMRGQVAFIQPRYVITVGTVALASVRSGARKPKLQQLHGRPLFWDKPPAPAKPSFVWPTYHPSAALRSGKYQETIIKDLKAFVAFLEGGCKWPELCYVCEGTFYRYDEWGVGYCERHAQHQGLLFPEDVGV